MAIPIVITSQSGGRQFDGTNLTKYSMFVGGVNATNNALRQYTPLVNGYCRLFMVRPPYAIMNIFARFAAANTASLSITKHVLAFTIIPCNFAFATARTVSTPIAGMSIRKS